MNNSSTSESEKQKLEKDVSSYEIYIKHFEEQMNSYQTELRKVLSKCDSRYVLLN